MYVLTVKYSDVDKPAKHNYRLREQADEWFDDIARRAAKRIESMFIFDPSIGEQLPLRTYRKG